MHDEKPNAKSAKLAPDRNIRGWRTAVAISQEAGRLNAVAVQRQAGKFEVLWAKSCEGNQSKLGSFAAECGLPIEQPPNVSVGGGIDGDRVVVAGFNSAAVAFYRLWVPAIKEKDIEAVVRLQAETLLPLSAEQVELTWRLGRTRDGEVAVTVAAARRERLQEFVENVRGFGPAKILLDYEGIVKAWQTFFGGDLNEGDAAVVNMGARSTQVCLVEDGRLSNAAVVDIGADELLEGGGVGEQTEATEGFARDVASVLKLFGCAEPGELPVFVLSGGGDAMEGIVSSLKSAGLDARESPPLLEQLQVEGGISAEELYGYRVPIGLAMMGLEAGTELNLFEQLYRPFKKEEKKHWAYSLKAAGAIAAVTLALLVIVSYAVDAASPGAIEKRLKAAVSDADISALVQRQKLIKTVAAERPDLLEVLNYISSSGSKGILLDSVQFKKGQAVSITGQVDNPDLLYKFQESLLTKKGVKEVEIQNAAKDPKGDKFKFTITFHYKNFTKKGTGISGISGI